VTRGLFEGIPLIAVLLGTVAVFLLAAEAGYRFGRRTIARSPAGSLADLGTTLGGLLGLLGLLLAFTFGMAGNRFDDRRKLVVDEANAIGTAWLRTDLVPEPMRSQARGILRDYTQTRLDAAAAEGAGPRAEAIARSERLQGALWSVTAAAANAQPSVTVTLFVTAVNEVIDLHGLRLAAAMRNPIPPIIFGTLYAVSLLVLAALGYSRGLVGDRSAVATVILSVVLAVVLALILDLDRPGEGFLRVGQHAMRDVRALMGP
jgi:uncharacterized membrane protein